MHVTTGTKVMMLYGSANRDERMFDYADRFDVGRAQGRHMGFGHGIHSCAGAALARLVCRVFFPALRIVQDGPLDWVRSPTFRSLASLRVAAGR